MKRILVLALCSLSLSTAAFAGTCEELSSFALPHGTITGVILEPAGALGGLTAAPLENLPSFCRVMATLEPTRDSNIRIEVWMPATNWNGKFEGTGNGGYAGGIAYGGLASGVRRGYAVANTDMGTSPVSGQNGEVLIGHPEKWRDWGSRSTHEMTAAAKLILAAYYGAAPKISYYVGCSTGGQQGLVEAQRFPDDYDGVIAGAPANNRTHLHMGFIWDEQASEATPGSAIPEVKLAVIADAVLKACVAQKAFKTDKFLTNPASCDWDPQEIECKAGDGADCLTAEQVDTARKLYAGPANPVTHAAIYPGLTRGSEFDWRQMTPKGGPPRYDALFKWTFGADWDWRKFDFNHDVTAVDDRLAEMVNAVNPDLGTFKAHGHKLLVYHGWADVVVPSLESVNYYEAVENAEASEAASHKKSVEDEVQGFYRLFMVPGMAHCAGGPGMNTIETMESLETWVEQGIAPDRILTKHNEKGVTQMTRPACAYPAAARYRGKGDPNDEANFVCVAPRAARR